MELYNLGRAGYYKDGQTVFTFEMVEDPVPSSTINMSDFSAISQPVILNIGNYYILLKGADNNLSYEIEQVIGANRTLPKMIEKQATMLYGKGPRLYKEVFADKKLVREWQQNEVIEDWLDNWQEYGLPQSSKEFCEKIIYDHYYFEDHFVKWRFFKQRRLGSGTMIAGLEHIDEKRCRLASPKSLMDVGMDYEDKDFDTVIVGNWKASMEKQFKIYPRLRPASILNYQTAVSYHKRPSVGNIYGYNRFYAGIKEWLTGTNRNPQYINSYLENSLNAKVHVIIPQMYVDAVEKKLQDYCEQNVLLKEANKELLTPNGITIGAKYSVDLRDAYIAKEFAKLTSMLSGIKNQGKAYASFSYLTSDGTAEWQIIPIDLKYGEYINTLINYDKRADEVVSSSLGLDPTITNISKDGVISKSGTDLYYNYIIYLHNLPLAEEKATEALNLALKINFQDLYRQGYRLGFYNEIPSRQQDVPPNDRLQNTLNTMQNSLTQTIHKQNDSINEIKNLVKNGH
jgi:hypothetical protein